MPKKDKKNLRGKIASLKKKREQYKTELKKCTSLDANYTQIVDNIFKNSPISTILVRKNKHIEFINPTFIQTFGYSLEEVYNIKDWFRLAHPNKKYRDKVIDVWRADIKKSQLKIPKPKTFKVKCRDGSEKDIKFSFIKITDDLQIVFMENVTPLVQYERRLSENERKIREIFDNTNDAIFIWNYNSNRMGRCIEVNNYAINMLGYEKDEIFSFTPNRIIDKKYQIGFKHYIENQTKEEKLFFEAELVTKAGRNINVEISSRVFKLNDKKVILAIARDVSERKKVHDQLIANEQKFRSIVENSPIGFMIIDNMYTITYGNKQLATIVGYNENEIVGTDFRVFLDNEYKKAITERYKNRQLGLPEPSYYEIKIIRKDGSSRWIGLSSVVNKSSDDKTTTYTHVIDVTDRKNSLMTIKASEERFRMMMEQSPLAMQIYNPDGSVVRVNNAWYKLWNLNPDKVSLVNYNILKDHNSQTHDFREAFQNALLGHSIEIPDILFNPRLNDWNGRERFINSKIYPLKNDSGKVNYIIMLYEDITDRKKTSQALLDSEERYRSLYENATVGIFSSTLDCRIILANPTFVSMLGYSTLEEMKKDSLCNDRFFNAEEKQYLRKTLLTYGEVTGLEIQLRKNTGEWITVLLNAKSVRNRVREIEYIEGITEDITDRKKAEEAIIKAKEEAEKSSKLKSEFLAQVSHEIRTPVNTILSFAGLLAEELAEIIPDDLKPSFGMMKNAGKRMIRTIDLILNMSEIQTGTYQPLIKEINLYEDVLYNQYLEYLSLAHDKDLQLLIQNKLENPIVIGDQYTVSEVFNNLVNNAVKYTHRGKVSITIDKNDAGDIFVDISDTGIGIAEDYMPFIFEPFSQEDQGYTRKFEGNGLGLALVQKYCQLNEAVIFVESKKGVGSKFRVQFSKVKKSENEPVKKVQD